MIRNRHLVLLTALVWAILITPYPPALGGWGTVLTLALIAVDVALGLRTGWLGFSRSGSLDEREAALRNRAYRIAFRLLIAGILFMVLAGWASTIISFAVLSNPGAVSVPDPLGARGIIALLELLLILPTAVIAWRQPDRLNGPIITRSRRAWLPVVAIPLAAGVWFGLVAMAPGRTMTVSQVPSTNLQVGGTTCGVFAASREVGFGFGGALRLRATVCWNGQQAGLFGDPNLPQPAFLGPLFGPGPSDPFLTSCSNAVDATDFATITEHRCTETIDPDGTMHYLVRGRVAPGIGDLGARDLRIELSVTRDGRIVSFG